MADVPAVVNYGRVTGRFVSFRADGSDSGNVPDEVPLTGKITLTPTVGVMRWRHTTPPRMSVIETVICQIDNGDLVSPDGGDLYLVATDQPDADPNIVQWVASFQLDGVKQQPANTTFNVPTDGVIDLAVVYPADEEPGVVIVVSAEDRIAAEAAASAAEQSAIEAAQNATNAAQQVRSELSDLTDRSESAADDAEDAQAAAQIALTQTETARDAAQQAALEAAELLTDVGDTDVDFTAIFLTAAGLN